MAHDIAERDRELVPRFLVRAVGTLMLISLVLVAYARFTDRPLEAVPPEGAVAAERVVVLFSDMSGAVRVLDAQGSVVADLGPEEGGFISGVGRALARERTKHGVPETAPVRLVRYADGRIALFDDLTGWRAELIGFGRDNAAAFARLLAE